MTTLQETVQEFSQTHLSRRSNPYTKEELEALLFPHGYCRSGNSSSWTYRRGHGEGIDMIFTEDVLRDRRETNIFGTRISYARFNNENWLKNFQHREQVLLTLLDQEKKLYSTDSNDYNYMCVKGGLILGGYLD